MRSRKFYLRRLSAAVGLLIIGRWKQRLKRGNKKRPKLAPTVYKTDYNMENTEPRDRYTDSFAPWLSDVGILLTFSIDIA